MKQAPPLPHHAVTFHRQRDVVLLHWRVDASLVSARIPRGCRPDLYDGSAWVGLVAYVFRDSTVPPLPPPRPGSLLGRLGTMTEITVETPTVDDAGNRGIAYLTIDTQHLPAIAAARLGIGLPYTFAHAGSRRSGLEIAHRTRRARGGPHASIRVAAGDPVPADDGFASFVTDRFGVHARHLGRTSWWRLTRTAWQVRRATVLELDENLLAACGLPGLHGRAPDSVLCADGADVEYSRG